MLINGPSGTMHPSQARYETQNAGRPSAADVAALKQQIAELQRLSATRAQRIADEIVRQVRPIADQLHQHAIAQAVREKRTATINAADEFDGYDLNALMEDSQ